MFEKKPQRYFPDRPFECGECKKTIVIQYTEIIGDSITHTSMCADCPELQKRLYGMNPSETVASQTGTFTGLACGNCGTTLEEVKRGHSLGCAECYSVFEDTLINELQASHAIPSRYFSAKKSSSFHIGRSPGENLSINLSSKILALNEALKETLTREDYEQAAWLRDQIKALTFQENVEELPEDKKDEPV